MNFLHAHKDTIEVVAVGAGGLTASVTVVDHVLRLVLTLASIAFVFYKWHKESKRK